MKKSKHGISLKQGLVIVCMAFPPLAHSADLLVGSVLGAPGSTVSVPITLNNDGTVAALQLDLQYDVTQLTAGNAITGSALAAGYRVVSSEPVPGQRRIIVVPPISNPTLATGAVISVPFTIQSTAGNSSKALSISQVVLSSNKAVAIPPVTVIGGLIVDPTNKTADTDKDGMPDVYEIAQGFNPMDPSDAAKDPDMDGLTNLQEYALGTDPHRADTDGDSMPDGWEVAHLLNPLNPNDANLDPDGDGVTNLNEFYAATDPNVAQPPAALANVAAHSGDGTTTISWDASRGAASYNLYWSNTPGVTQATGTVIKDVTRPYVHTGLKNGTSYYYVVAAANPGGESPLSTQLSVTPRSPTWGTPSLIEFDKGTTQDARVATDDLGNAIALLRQKSGTLFNINANRYDVATAQWQSATTLIAANADNPQVAMTPAGQAMAVWTQTDLTGQHLYASRSDTKSNLWSAPETLASGLIKAFDTKIALAKNGDVLVLWKQPNSTAPLQTDLYSVRYTAASSQWGAVTQIVAKVITPQIGVAANGQATAVWLQPIPATLKLGIYSSRFDSLTSLWTTPVQLDTHTGIALMPQVATDANGNANAIWTYLDTTTFKFNLSTARFDSATGLWGAANVITAGAPVAITPKVAMGGTGDIVAVWEQINKTGTGLYSTRYNSATSTWAVPVAIESISGVAAAPQVSIDAKGKVFAVWAQLDAATRKTSIYGNRYEPASAIWGTPQLLENNPGDAYVPALAVSAIGNAVAVWTQWDGTTNNTWANDYWIGDTNRLPFASAGTDQTATGGATITLNGNLSTDPDGAADIVSYTWNEVSGLNTMPAGASGPTPTITIPAVAGHTILRYQLTVTDKAGTSTGDLIDVNVSP